MALSRKKALLTVGDRIRYSLRSLTTILEVANVGNKYYYFNVIQGMFDDYSVKRKQAFIYEVDFDIKNGEFVVINNHGIKRAIKRIKEKE